MWGHISVYLFFELCLNTIWVTLLDTQQEIQNAYHTNALLVKLLLSQAQESGVELQVSDGASYSY